MSRILAFFMGPMGKSVGLLIAIAAMVAGSYWKGYSAAERSQAGKTAERLREDIALANKRAKIETEEAIRRQAEAAQFAKSNDELQKKFAELQALTKHNPACDDKATMDALNAIIRNTRK